MTVRPLYPHELIELADRLAGHGSGPGRPRTVDLRRAVSTAYYGLFHAWTWAAAAALFGDATDRRVSAVTRWIAHADVLELAKAVLLSTGSVTRNKVNAAKYIAPILDAPVDDEVVRVCRTFMLLQEERHKADYDRDYVATWEAAAEAVDDARNAWITLWRLYAEGDPNTVLLLRLSIGATRIAKAY